MIIKLSSVGMRSVGRSAGMFRPNPRFCQSMKMTMKDKSTLLTMQGWISLRFFNYVSGKYVLTLMGPKCGLQYQTVLSLQRLLSSNGN